jgi:hypothetical protein
MKAATDVIPTSYLALDGEETVVVGQCFKVAAPSLRNSA